jgi:hypothetical protein
MDMPNDLITIATYGSPEEAEVARNALQAEGLQAFLDGVATVGNFWHMGNAVGGVRLLIAEADAERALSVLRTPEDDTSARDDLGEWICPRCASPVGLDFDVCWSCGTTRDGAENADFAAYARVPADAELDGGATPAETADGEADSEDQVDTWTSGDAIAHRALRAAVIGMVFCPPLPCAYSAWLLSRLDVNEAQLSDSGRRWYRMAFWIDLVFIGTAAVVLALVFNSIRAVR